ncbi:unnamed protein product [Dovyalis caffra]|uniref:BHLH domain-containing protein n=1 Tax=Dovyalis caffra TaxID=77055 RepID=A0AAV1RAM5_9ROSI|nr:unnamed protein product [Dovyalis caffra]
MFTRSFPARCTPSSSTLPPISKTFADERRRREKLNELHKILRNLVPNRTRKFDRLTAVEDAIEYIKELAQRARERKPLMEQRRSKRNVVGDTDEGQDYNKKPLGLALDGHFYNNGSFINNQKVDVRVVDDVSNHQTLSEDEEHQHPAFFVQASKVLYGLQLDLQYFAGKKIGDRTSLEFRTEYPDDELIKEGESTKYSSYPIETSKRRKRNLLGVGGWVLGLGGTKSKKVNRVNSLWAGEKAKIERIKPMINPARGRHEGK